METAAAGPPKRRLPRSERRAQLVEAAARSFLRGGFAGTSLDDVAAAAGVTKVIIYRHFESKRELYLAVLLDTRQRIEDHLDDGEPPGGGRLIGDFIAVAREVPDGFRVLYRQASREPEFAVVVDELKLAHVSATEKRLRDRIPDSARRRWLASMGTELAVEAILTWLDADQPVEPTELGEIVIAGMRAMIDEAG